MFPVFKAYIIFQTTNQHDAAFWILKAISVPSNVAVFHELSRLLPQHFSLDQEVALEANLPIIHSYCVLVCIAEQTGFILGKTTM